MIGTTPIRKAAPTLAGERGHEGTRHRISANATRFEYGLLAALVAYPSAIERFRELGAGPSIFSDPNAQTLASWALATWHKPTPDTIPPEVLRAACAAEPGRPSLLDDLARRVDVLHQCPDGDTWAVSDVDRYAALLARRWLPPFLRWWADELEEGDAPHAEREVFRLVRWLEGEREGVAA